MDYTKSVVESHAQPDLSLTLSRNILEGLKGNHIGWEASQNTGYFLSALDMAIREMLATSKSSELYFLYYGKKVRLTIESAEGEVS